MSSMDLVSLEAPSLGAMRPPPEIAEERGKRVKSEPKTPFELKRIEDLEESDFSMFDDDSRPYIYGCKRFVYRNKAMIELDKAIAEYKERSRNLSSYDAIAPPPNSGLCGSTWPIPITDDIRPSITELCNVALEKYNADNQGANFVFHDLVKTTRRLVCGYMYFITFQAKDATHPSNSTVETFQAQVWDRKIPQKLEPVVESCTIKPTS